MHQAIRVRSWGAAVLLSGALACTHGLDIGEARHLVNRTGFGATPADIEAVMPLTREQAVDALLQGIGNRHALAPPTFCNEALGPAIARREQEWKTIYAKPEGPERENLANAKREEERKQGLELKNWWYQEMLATPSPLTERLVLFWHNHFTSAFATVENPRLMWEQNRLFRSFAAGNYALLLIEIPRDPAMFIYLDSNSNVRGRPNENFAREVMELFTVGEGHYSEQDVKEAARAFTGYKLDKDTGKPVKNDGQHDGERKTVLGHKGIFDADKIMELLLLAEERVALHVTEKLWREFINDEPDAKAVYKLATTLYRARYELKPLLRAVLLSEPFWAPANRGALVKSPVDLLVGTCRTLDLAVNDPPALVAMGRKLGQDLMDPPNVKGWRGGPAWISSQSLLARWEVLEEIQRGRLGGGKGATIYAKLPPQAAPEDRTAGRKKPDGKAGARPPAGPGPGMGGMTGGDDGPGMMGGGMGGGMMDGGSKEGAAVGNPKGKDKGRSTALTSARWMQAEKSKGPAGVERTALVLLAVPPSAMPTGDYDAVVAKLLDDPAYHLR